MKEILKPGAGVLFMKVGVHAGESLESIIARKTKEIDEAGFAMWGYGGNTCHPKTMVQPFAGSHEERGRPIWLVMNEMKSNHFAEQVRATHYSSDDLNWTDVPPAINVLGSRYALVIDSLQREEFVLSLDETRVAVGLSRGRVGSRYVVGRADKACLEIAPGAAHADQVEPRPVSINLVAKLRPPYAVFLR